jgi:hypothetical protein
MEAMGGEEWSESRYFEGTYWGIMRGSVDFSMFDAHFNTSGAGGIGLNEEMDTVRSNHLAFDRMKVIQSYL